MDYEIQIKIKNARLLTAMENASVKSVKQLIDDTGLSRSFIDSMMNLTISTPFESDGITYKENLTFLANFLGVIESDLLPDGESYQPLMRNFTRVRLESSQIKRMISSTENPENLALAGQFKIDDLCEAAGLKPREIAIITNRFEDGMTLEQCGNEHGISSDRARQIEAKALRKIRLRAAKADDKVLLIADSWH